MRKAPRGDKAPPAALAKPVKGRTELEHAQAHYADPYDPKTGSYGFKVYKAAEVKERLDELFFGKCAYCETFYASSAPVDIEHYRPKGAVEGEPDHRGYWWLAMAWENLLPSCIDCNRRRKQPTPKPGANLAALDQTARFSASRIVLTGKKDLFPLAPMGVRATGDTANLDAEQALLLNPCEDDPADHLVHHVERAPLVGLVLPKGPSAGVLPAAAAALAEVADAAAQLGLSVRGAVSIQVYGLNRLGLVQDRTRVLRRLEFLEVLIIELSSIIESLEDKTDPDVIEAVRKLESLKQQTLAEMNAMADVRSPYSSMAAAWIEAFTVRLLA
ncbi:HNH endonuclease [Brevundimonas sp. PAMC22021]|uniref:HNH endonuclease n=1 Tax=Brevundimonas sp. PAMC22021 TaxID=2861285 RepID=UPI001C6292A9|nr:HNH endonuclease [Brevundimonas sp. PAMC22021]QYF86207.1 HNH endonuclease [Brevundimonas sp. PAMC22021]